ncbi:hypothetical protein ACWD4G_22100 [Streptomyces sp. NPDC002643]
MSHPHHQPHQGPWPPGQGPYPAPPGQGQFPAQQYPAAPASPNAAPPNAAQQYPSAQQYPAHPPYGGPPAPPHLAPPHAPAPMRPAPPRSKGTGFGCLAGVLGVFGALALAGGGFLVNHAYSNHSQVIPNRTAYGPTMWRNEPVDELFPDVLAPTKSPTSDEADPERATWHRLGISEDTDCAAGLNKVTAAAVKDLDCEAVLRATYVDPTGNTLGTVALAVLPGGQRRMTEFLEKDADKLDPEVGAKPYAVPDTLAAKWNGARSNGGAGLVIGDATLPYVLIASTGSVDGRKAGRLPGEWGSHSWSAGDDRAPWRGAAKSLCDDLNAHLSQLLSETA